MNNNPNTLVLTVAQIGERVYHLKKENGQINLYLESENGKLTKSKSKISISNLGKFEEKLDDIVYLTITGGKNHYLAIFGFGRKFYIGQSKNGTDWEIDRKIDKKIRSGIILPDYKFQGKNMIYWSDNDIRIGSFDKTSLTFYDDPIYSPESFSGGVDILAAIVQDEAIYIPFTSEFDIEGKKHFSLSLVIFDKNDPRKIKWRIYYPIWNVPLDVDEKILSPIAILKIDNKIYSFWRGEKEVFKFHHSLLSQIILDHPKKIAELDKATHNPLLSPDPGSDWESIGVFNPATLYDEDEKKLHLMYRAVGKSWRSNFGYATSSDGQNIDSKEKNPIYSPRASFEGQLAPSNPDSPFTSGPGSGGCEDPRLTKIDGKVYLTYVAYDGWNGPRVAMSSISYEDFKNKNWDWSYPVLISKPGLIDKNAVIFPEKINGKYVIMHRVFPDILIDFVDSLDFDGRSFLEGRYKITPRKIGWDSRKVGAGPPPIKTKDGWLLIYHAVDDRKSHQYQMGAMLLDLEDPTKILHRSTQPILRPTHWYENEGSKSGVVYPCGSAIINNTLHVYYGGADTFVCVATAPLNTFLERLKMEKNIKTNSYYLS